MSTRRTAASALLAVIAGGVLTATTVVAQEGLPSFTASVVDEAGVVPDDAERQLAATLDDFRRRTGKQLALAVVESIGDSDLETYANELFRDWELGDEGEDDGVLLLVVMDDRDLRIEVGRGVEGDLTDVQSGRIIRDVIVPRMGDDVGAALQAGAEAIRVALGDDLAAEPAPIEETDDDGGASGWSALAPILVFGLVAARVARRRGRGGGFGGFGGPIIWGGGFGGGGFGGGGFGGGGFGGGGFGGGGFGGGGGGGFGGGGGGSSGGGGASGGW